jgi:uncharacterized protein (DUF1330 family)
MAAYVIADIDVRDAERYEEYRQLVTPSIAAYGGRYLVRGGETAILEGDWLPRRCVVIEFPSVEQARAWWDSEAYAPAKEIRRQSAKARMILVAGAL